MKRLLCIALVALLLCGCSAPAATADTEAIRKAGYDEGYAVGYADGVASVAAPSAPTAQEPAQEPTQDNTEPQPDAANLTFNDTFVFDGFEITFLPDVAFDTLENQFSDDNGADVIELPVTIVNKSGETGMVNMFYYKFYAPDGLSVNKCGSYFDNDIDQAGSIRDGATLNTTMHILYKGDGDYYVEFADFNTKIEAKLPIAK